MVPRPLTVLDRFILRTVGASRPARQHHDPGADEADAGDGAGDCVVRAALSAASAATFVVSRSRGWFRPGCDGGTMAATEYKE